jgi:DNA-binding SARP family transcriptional activator
MRVCVLGPVEARLGDAPDAPPLDLGGPKQRALLAALALHRGRPVPSDQLVDLLWSRDAPPGAAQTLQNHVAGLRRALEPDRASRTPATVVVTAPPGYALHLPPGGLDVDEFESVVGRVHRLLRTAAPLPSPDQELAEAAVADLDRSLASWRGEPYRELGDAPSAVAERVRLEELRMVALEDRAVASLSLGAHATVAAELEALTLEHPLRERLWALRAVALTRAGRQADALDVLAEVRTRLVEELGIEPGPELQALQTAVLRQDPSLTWTAPAPPVPQRPPTPAPTPAATPTPTATSTAAPAAVPTSPWPLVGRDAERDALTALLDVAAGGTPRFAALVGDPGIGKSRLLAELAAAARARSATVLVGRCSQDEGAPPLWPWAGVLEGLGLPLPTEPASGQTDESTRFRTWDDIVRAVHDAARERLVLVLLDDLHWADPSTLRVLGLLLETVHDGRLVVVSTWRADPPPSGALGAVAEQLARRHALRLDLVGLDADEVTAMVEAVSHHRPARPDADALRERTDGNPFFVLEYARLAGEHGDLTALLAEPVPPHGVADVVRRRLERLSGDARSALVPAAVLGRDFGLRDLAAVLGWDEDRVLDTLDEAVTAGLVREDGVDAFRFSHALVRDTVHSGVSPTRRGRWHAKAAEVLQGRADRAGEVARHWHQAGPEYVDRAWRAARLAAREALRLYAYEEAVELLTDALVVLAQDPTATDEDEYDVLIELGLADKATGDWINLRQVVHRGIAVADRLGDPIALARVAVMTSIDALWQSAYHGEVDEVIVDALRRALDGLPATDNELRCRTMMALAGELYYGVSAQERDALAEESVAMARRIGDPALLMSTCQNAFVVTWRPGTVEQRVELAAEALTIAEELRDARMLVYARTLRAVVASETGDVATYTACVTAARETAEEQRNLYALVVLDSLEIPWCAMRGQFERAGDLLEHMQALGERMGLSQQTDAVRGALLSIMVWQEQYEPVLEVLQEAGADEALPLDTSVLSMLTRLGRLEEARAIRAEEEIDLGGETWFSLLPWAMAADAALPLDDAELGATAYRLLAPHAGRMACAGSGVTLGPVDMYLAMAAAATGEHELAARHADAALKLCDAWQVPLVSDWFTRQRDRYAF